MKRNKKYIILQITKYVFIAFLLSTITITTLLIVYSNRFNYTIPNIEQVYIYDSNGNLFLSLNNNSRKSYAKISDIDQKIIDAFISIEDKAFYTHKGINIKRIIGALLSNVKSGEIVEGASTITQQYVKNVFLNSEKKLKRKIDEALIAMQIETNYSKDEILEGYLNTIYFDHGVYGIEDACRYYFNKSASDVTFSEAASLASIPKSPSNYSPIKNLERNLERRNLVLNEMFKDGKISSDELEIALDEELELYGRLDSTENENAPYFQDMVISELNKLNIDKDLLAKGIKVYTTLDNKLNTMVNNAIKKYYPASSGLQLAIFAINPSTGAVLDVIGGIDYNKSSYNRSISALRQPGSAIKPFLYYEALERGFTPATTFYSSKSTFYYNGLEYSPQNYKDIYPNRDVTMAYALATSDNMYAIKTHLFLGIDKLTESLKKFGFTSKINETISLALGTSEVTLSELTTAYSKIASMGKDVTLHYIDYITDIDGNIIYKNNSNFDELLNPDTCFILSETMTNVFDNNLAINISTTCANIASLLSHKYAAKSGSTDFDNWIIGYNKNIVLGIWTGFDDNRLIKNSSTRFIKYIWANVMEGYNKGVYRWYDVPKNVIGIELNPTTGNVAKSGEYKKELFFKTNNLPWFIYYDSFL